MNNNYIKKSLEYLRSIVNSKKKEQEHNDNPRYGGFNVPKEPFKERRMRALEEEKMQYKNNDKIDLYDKELSINKLYIYIQDFIKLRGYSERCHVTESEWRTFLGIAYDTMVPYNFHFHFFFLMSFGVEYAMNEHFHSNSFNLTINDVIEHFDIGILPPGVGEGMVDDIRRSERRKFNIISLEEYRNRRGK